MKMTKKKATKARQNPQRKKRKTNPDRDDNGGRNSTWKPSARLVDGNLTEVEVPPEHEKGDLTEVEVSPEHEDEMNKLLTSMLKGIAIIPLNLILTHLNHGKGVPVKACDRKDQKHWLGNGDGPLTLAVDDITNTDLKKLVNDSMWYGGFRGKELHTNTQQTNVLTNAEHTFVTSMKRYNSFLLAQSLGSQVFYRAMKKTYDATPTFVKAKLIGVWGGKHRAKLTLLAQFTTNNACTLQPIMLFTGSSTTE
jgi:hypothetical protein